MAGFVYRSQLFSMTVINNLLHLASKSFNCHGQFKIMLSMRKPSWKCGTICLQKSTVFHDCHQESSSNSSCPSTAIVLFLEIRLILVNSSLILTVNVCLKTISLRERLLCSEIYSETVLSRLEQFGKQNPLNF